MIRPIRVDHTIFLQVTIKTHSFIYILFSYSLYSTSNSRLFMHYVYTFHTKYALILPYVSHSTYIQGEHISGGVSSLTFRTPSGNLLPVERMRIVVVVM
jgi:hypothetical protein